MKKKKQFYFSVRVVIATSRQKAIERVQGEFFEEKHQLCDKVLTKDQLIDALTQKRKSRIKFDYIEFEGIKYRTREILVDGNYLTVSESALNDRLMIKGSKYRNKEARYIDEQIVYFCDENELYLPAKQLAKIIYN